jgi:hypothetical protein
MATPLRIRILKPAIKFALLLACRVVMESQGAAQPTTGWTLVWSDEFSQPDGSSPDTNNWAYDTGGGGWGNNELEYYTARTNNARIAGGLLVIAADQESYMGSSYTSARLKTQGKCPRGILMRASMRPKSHDQGDVARVLDAGDQHRFGRLADLRRN